MSGGVRALRAEARGGYTWVFSVGGGRPPTTYGRRVDEVSEGDGGSTGRGRCRWAPRSREGVGLTARSIGGHGRVALPLTFGACARMLAWLNRLAAGCGAAKFRAAMTLEGDDMKKSLSFVLLVTLFFAGSAFAADPIVGTWKLNVEKSKFTTGAALTAGTRIYTEDNGLYTLVQKLTGADGKEMSIRSTYRDSKEEKQAAPSSVDATLAKKVDANTWDFELKKNGKTVGHVHRTVSADGKTLTVHNTGMQANGTLGDQTLVFDKQ